LREVVLEGLSFQLVEVEAVPVVLELVLDYL
jgi:hypothetical protein